MLMDSLSIVVTVGFAVCAVVLFAALLAEYRRIRRKAPARLQGHLGSGPWRVAEVKERPGLRAGLAQAASQHGKGQAIEREFKNVFMLTSKEGQEALIKRWMDRTKCGRGEAMRLAVDEWHREQRSWR
jgi:hypothetical protein